MQKKNCESFMSHNQLLLLNFLKLFFSLLLMFLSAEKDQKEHEKN